MDIERIDVEEFTKAILDGDNERVIQVLDEFGLTKSRGVLLGSETRELVRDTLTFAALKARRGDLLLAFAPLSGGFLFIENPG